MAQAMHTPPQTQRHIPTRTMIAAAVALAAVIGIVLWLVLRANANQGDVFTGYVVSDDIFMSSPVTGTLQSVAVVRGQRVAPGDPLYQIEPTVRRAAVEQARAQIDIAKAQLTQQQAGFANASAEVAVAQADVDSNGAELRRLSAAQRTSPGSVVALNVEKAQAAYDGSLYRKDAASAQADTAAAGIELARAQLLNAQAGLAAAERELAELSPTVPRAGRIDDVMFKPGESVPPNVPIVSIVPDDQVKIRFYVPEPLINGYRPGRKVAIGCDGCAKGMTAVINFVAAEPEFTPPVIFSLQARQKLVFLVEAMPANPLILVPGQPMDVSANAAALPDR
jgi:HlyD family secretion protein